MAEALLTIMLENLNSLIQKEFGLLWGVNKEMERLSSILSTIHDVLEDAEEKQLRNREIKNWLQKLKDVSGELDDILDECSMEASLLEHKMQRFQKVERVKKAVISEHLIYLQSQAECFYVLLLIVTIFTHRDKSAVLLTSKKVVIKAPGGAGSAFQKAEDGASNTGPMRQTTLMT